jgi:hypothetical protein
MSQADQHPNTDAPKTAEPMGITDEPSGMNDPTCAAAAQLQLLRILATAVVSELRTRKNPANE